MAKLTLSAPVRIDGKEQPKGASVEIAEPRAGRLVERKRAAYAEPVTTRAELSSGRPVLSPE